MAMGTSVFQNSNTKYLKLKSKGGARFSIIERDQDGKYNEVATTKIVNGALESIDMKEGEFEGNKIYTVKITLVDNEEKYVIDINPETGLGRNTVASLLSIKELGHIMELSVYETKNADDPTKPYGNIALRYDKELLRWAYAMQDKTDASGLPALGTKKEKGKTLTDYYDRDMALVEKLFTHISTLDKPEKLDDMPTGVVSKTEESTGNDIETITEEDIDTVFPAKVEEAVQDRPF